MINIIQSYVRKKDGSKVYDRPYIFTVEKIDKMNEEVESNVIRRTNGGPFNVLRLFIRRILCNCDSR